MNNNIEKYDSVFQKIFDVDRNQLNENFTFASIDKWDSLKHLMLISELEEIFDIMFETDDILHFESYQNGIKILKRYGVFFSGEE